MFTQYIFHLLSILALFSAVMVLASKKPIHSVLFLTLTFFAIAGHYVLLNAQFLAVVHVIVYAGAIMVLFVFVIMLLNAEAEQPAGRSLVARYIGIPSLLLFFGLMALLLHALVPPTERVTFGAFAGGTPRNIGRVLFTDYLLPFEITSVLILVAILGAIVLAHKGEVRLYSEPGKGSRFEIILPLAAGPGDTKTKDDGRQV